MATTTSSTPSILPIRIALGYLLLFSIQIGAWALLAPRSFYDDFPGLGRVWISIDGPFNEHLIRDVGALNLALAALFGFAMVRPTRDRITIAAVAAMIWGLPHLLYHLVNTDGLAAGDAIASLAGLALFAAIPIGLIALGARTLPSTDQR